jgi:hypothetical protein
MAGCGNLAPIGEYSRSRQFFKFSKHMCEHIHVVKNINMVELALYTVPRKVTGPTSVPTVVRVIRPHQKHSRKVHV